MLRQLMGLGLIGLVSVGAQAQIYTCKDASGRTLTSDRPLPECANRPQKELSKNGVLVRDIPAPLTAEQARAKKEADEKRKADEAAAQEQRRRDVALVNTYPNEQAIEAERSRSVAQVRNNINISLTAQNNAQQRLKAAQTEADALRAKGKLVPSFLRKRVDEAQKSMDSEAHNVEALEAEMGRIKGKYEDILKRYRAVVNGPSASASSSSAPVSSAK